MTPSESSAGQRQCDVDCTEPEEKRLKPRSFLLSLSLTIEGDLMHICPCSRDDPEDLTAEELLQAYRLMGFSVSRPPARLYY